MRLRSILVSIFLTSSLFAAGRDVTTGRIGASPVTSSVPAVATAGGKFLTVWASRNNPAAGALNGSLSDATGGVLTQLPFVIESGATVSPVQLVEHQGQYVVLFTDASGKPALRRLLTEGQVVASMPDPPMTSLVMARMASNDDQILIVDATGSFFPPARHVGHLLNADGTVIKRDIPLTTGFGRIAVAPLNDGFIVATAENNGVFVQRIGPDGSVVAPGRVQVTITPGSIGGLWPLWIAIASRGDDAVVFWYETEDAANPRRLLYTSYIAPDGTASEPVQPAKVNAAVSEVALTANENGYLATVTLERAYAFKLDAEGKRRPGLATAVARTVSNLAAQNDVYVGVGLETFPAVSASAAVVGVSFRAEPSIGDARPSFLSLGQRRQVVPGVGSDGIDFLTAWSEEAADRRGLAYARMTRNGVSLDPEGREASLSPQSRPEVAVAYGEETWLMVWHEASGIFARRFRRDGTPIEAGPFAIRSGVSSRPAVAWKGNSFFVVWQEEGGLRGSFVPTTGLPGQALSITSNTPFTPGASEPVMAWNGFAFFVAWNTYGNSVCTCFPNPIDAEGIIVGADGKAMSSIFTVAKNTASINVAAGGTTFLAVVETHDRRLLAHRVFASGSVAAGTEILRPFGTSIRNVVFDGTDYVIGWASSAFNRRWLASAKLDANNVVHSRRVVEIGPEDGQSTSLGMAVNSLGEVMYAVSEIRDGSPVGRVRAYFDFDFAPMPAAPAVPTNVRATGTRDLTTLTWTATGDVAGFYIERGDGSLITTVGGDSRSATFRFAYADSIQIRAVGPGGSSAPSALTVISNGPRRRSTR